ncbi:MAG: hypothetical protein ACE5J9_02140 [Methanosarcinales archaeon]
MSKEKSVLLEFLGDHTVVRIIDFLIENRMFDYSKKQISEGAGVDMKSLHEYWDVLEESGIVKPTRLYGDEKLYKLEEKNPVVHGLLQLELDLIKHYAKIDVKAEIEKEESKGKVPIPV